AVAGAPELLPAMAYLSLVPTLGAYGLYLTGLQLIESSHASILATIEPVVAALLGYLMLSEPLTLPQVAGIALVLFGAFVLQAGSRARTS
ncbi:MAG TPA: EamA family transporter, partial [Symbiobacteriaceae bacterium]|nr:EamA family transporter [Symbiobacteriaceae bacterium]